MSDTRPIGERSTLDIVRWLPALAASYLTLGLGWLSFSSGFRLPRLALFALVVALAWIGAAGAATRRFRPTVAGVAGLFLLGVWETVLWAFTLPAVALLSVVGLLMWTSGDVRV